MKTKIISLIVVVIMLSINSCKDKNSGPSMPLGNIDIGTNIGQTAPDFSLPDKDGNEKSLYDYHGQVVLIDFWASWCHFCREENPELIYLYSEYRSKGFEIVGVSLDTDRNNWLDAIQNDGIEFVQLSDLKGSDSPVVISYGVVGIPKMVLIDKDGKILLITSKASEVATFVKLELDK
ncbi:MAG: TlpA disulfide reductase family protein [Bacteroidota bacterium]